jgi:hypothetical protein
VTYLREMSVSWWSTLLAGRNDDGHVITEARNSLEIIVNDSELVDLLPLSNFKVNNV